MDFQNTTILVIIVYGLAAVVACWGFIEWRIESKAYKAHQKALDEAVRREKRRNNG